MAINPKVIDIYHGDDVAPDGFAQARRFGIVGVIHKASEGSNIVDNTYAGRRALAKDAGLLWGAYHFIRPVSVSDQVNLFLRTAHPDEKTLLALDYEVDSVSLDQARAFIEQVEAKVGRSVVLYSGNTIKEKLGNRIDPWWGAHRLWLAQYGSHPTVPPCWPKPWLWQYTGDAKGPLPHQVPGIQGNIDINHWDGTDDELAGQWAGVVAVAAAQLRPHEIRGPVGNTPIVPPPVVAGASSATQPPVMRAPLQPPPPQQGAAAALGQLLAALNALNAGLARMRAPESGAASSTPILSPIDKSLGGEAMVGLKTPLAIAAYVVLWILQSTSTIGTATGDHATTTGQVLTALIAAFGGLGITAKLDRWVQSLNMLAGAQQLPVTSATPQKT